MFDTQTTFSPTLSDIEALKELKQTGNIADDNLFGGLRVKSFNTGSHLTKMDTISSLFLVLLTISITLTNAAIEDAGNDRELISQLLRDVEHLKQRDTAQQQEINSLKSKLTFQGQKSSQLEATIVELEQKLEECSNDGANEIDEIREKVKDVKPLKVRQIEDQTPIVAFHATLNVTKSHVGANQIIAFDKVFTNIGTAFNPHFGTFVAPMSGVYVFSTTVMSHVSHDFHCSLVKNRQPVAKMYVRAIESAYGNDSVMVVIHLDKGDDVAVEMTDSDKIVLGYDYSMFSGFLLHPDQPMASIVGK